ncbi:MAG: hypothetical protein HYU64_01435 [Armatimonadetes bacterium]|nr:hypothetical protein [Armatimonadota bacterium]
MRKHSPDLAGILLLTLLSIFAASRGFGEDPASAVVLGFSGNVDLCPKSAPSGCRRVGLMRLLYPGDVLRLPKQSTVTIKFVKDGHREAASGVGKLIIGPDSCKGKGTLVRRLPGYGKLLALRDKKCVGDHLGAAFTDRPSSPKPAPVPAPRPQPESAPSPSLAKPPATGGANKSYEFPEKTIEGELAKPPAEDRAKKKKTIPLPPPDPHRREIFCSLHPTFTWRIGAGEVWFFLYEGEEPPDASPKAKAPYWSARTAENRVAYPQTPTLQWGASYFWKVLSASSTGLESGGMVASGSFRLPRNSEAAQQLCDARGREAEFLKRKDPESLVEVVLLYFDNGYYEESLPLLQTLATVRNDPTVHYLLAKVYYRQGNRAQGDWEKQQFERLGGDKETYVLP